MSTTAAFLAAGIVAGISLTGVGLSGMGDSGMGFSGGAEPDSASDGPGSPLAFEMDRLDGTSESLETYRGDVVLIVNTASRCGLTPQFEALQSLYERYSFDGLTILGFPSDNFAGQEPLDNGGIAEFCKQNYGVSFPMFSKIDVKGDTAHPLYKYLADLPAPLGGEPEWNFQKFLVNREGEVVARFSPRTKPDAAEVIEQIEQLLAEGE